VRAKAKGDTLPIHPAEGSPRTRRPRGAARQLLLEAARDLFSRQDYRGTTTREIAELAGVNEHLLFRHFGSKAALFREALVVPFVELVDDFASRWNAIVAEDPTEDDVASQFIGSIYDLFVEHRGLIMTMWASDALSEQELADTGVDDIDRALGVMSELGAAGIDIRGLHAGHPDLAARSSVAMIAGMAAFGSTFFGGERPSRDAIVDELTQATLHGFLHRPR
jgi:AcrR family transcriptional regulator